MTGRPAPRIWVTRAQPGAERTARRLMILGFEPVVQPLLTIQPLSPALPELNDYAALAFTSANGVTAFAALTPRRDLSVLSVGDATAEAARAAGFSDVRSADGDLKALATLIAADLPPGPVLAPIAEAPAGNLAQAVREAGGETPVHALAVYRAVPTRAAAPDAVGAVLIHSPRAARLLIEAIPPGPYAPILACISPAAAAPLIPHGLTVVVSATPREETLLATLQGALGKRDPRV